MIHNVMASEARIAPGHWSVFGRTIFEGGGVSVRHNLILAGGGAQAHRHDFEHIFFVLRGSLRVACGGQTTVVPAGCAFQFEPGELHQVCGDGVSDAEYLTINVSAVQMDSGGKGA